MPEEHVRRLDVGPVDRSTYRQKASDRRLGHRAKKSGYCAKDIGVAESTGRLGNRPQGEDDAPKNQTKRRGTNDMPDNLINCLGLIVSIEVFVFVCAGLTTMKDR